MGVQSALTLRLPCRNLLIATVRTAFGVLKRRRWGTPFLDRPSRWFGTISRSTHWTRPGDGTSPLRNLLGISFASTASPQFPPLAFRLLRLLFLSRTQPLIALSLTRPITNRCLTAT